jgi:hypothetical protein
MNKNFIIITIGLILSIFGATSTRIPSEYQKFRVANIQKDDVLYWTVDLYNIKNNNLEQDGVRVKSEIISTMLEHDSEIINIDTTQQTPTYLICLILTIAFGVFFIFFVLIYLLFYIKLNF